MSKTQKTAIRNKSGSALRIILPVLLIAAVALTGGFVYRDYKEKKAQEQWLVHMTETVERDAFYEGIYLDGVSLGGMTLTDAEKLFEQKSQEILDKLSVELVYGDKSWVFSYEDIAASIDYSDRLSELYALARAGSLEDRYNEVQELQEKNITKETALTKDTSLIRDRIQEIADSLRIEPVDADVAFFPDRDDKFEYTAEKAGQMVDAEALYDEAVRILESGEPGRIEITPIVLEPKVFVSDLKKANSLVAVFSTDLLSSTAARAHNVELALGKINGLKINPGEIFSFNDSVGPRTKDAGFLPAPVIMPDKSMKDDWGGGVCQASTTVFYAAAISGLEIVERYHHSFPVAYVPKGMDASVVYGGADLKFRNNRTTPVFIKTYRKGKLVYVEFWGEPIPESESYRLETELLESIPAPEPVRILDKEGKYVSAPGGEKYHVLSRPGYRLTTYRVRLDANGKEVSREVLVKNYYRPIQGKIYYREGTPQQQQPGNSNDSNPQSGEPSADPSADEQSGSGGGSL